MTSTLNAADDAVALGARDAEAAADLVGRPSLAVYCRDDETFQFVLVGADDGLSRGSDDWQTTQEPGRDSGVLVLVTDRRTIFVVGDCRDPEVEDDYVRQVKHADVDDVTVERSFLSSSFVLTTVENVRLSVTPSTTDGISDVKDYVDRASMRWQDAPAVFDSVDEEAEAIQTLVLAGDIEDARQRKRSVISSLQDLNQTSSIYHVDLPALDLDRKRARQRLSNALSVGHWRRVEYLVEEADDELERSEVGAAAATYQQACESFDAMTSNADTGDNPFSDVEATGELAPAQVGETLLDRLEVCGERADEAADPTVSLSAWKNLVDGYDAVRSAVSIDRDVASLTLDEARSLLGRAARRTAESQVAVAKQFEERGDEAMDAGNLDAGRDEFERGIETLDERRDLAARFDEEVDPDGAAAIRERLEDKIAETQWEWGGS